MLRKGSGYNVWERDDCIDDEELAGGVILCDLGHCLLEQESRGDDEIEAFVGKSR